MRLDNARMLIATRATASAQARTKPTGPRDAITHTRPASATTRSAARPPAAGTGGSLKTFRSGRVE